MVPFTPQDIISDIAYVLYLKNWIIRASMAEKAVSELKDTSQELLEKLGEEEQ